MPVLGEIIGWEILVPLALIALLFGSSKIPQLARSLGEASHEFHKGTRGEAPAASDADTKAAAPDVDAES
jgi:sec-independent protein translocase protein TatA